MVQIYKTQYLSERMDDYKKQFIDLLLKKEALTIGEFELKSGRISPYFINIGMLDNGQSIRKLGNYYAAEIMNKFAPEEFDIIFGPAYKSIPLSVTTTIALSGNFDINKGYAFDRKEPKNHGEGTKQEKQKRWIVGHKIEDDNRILMLDDVFTTGNTKNKSIYLLNSLADNLKYIGLVIAVDRQEVGLNGINAIKQFEEKTDIPVYSIVTISEIIEHLENTKKIMQPDKQRLEDYLREHGIEEVKKSL